MNINIDGVKVVKMQEFIDVRGTLSVASFNDEFPFLPKRIFFAYNVPALGVRGEHAHRECKEILICLNGQISVFLDNGTCQQEVTLNSPNIGLYLPPMIWRKHYKYRPNSVLCVLASTEYASSDYINDYQEFLREVSL